MAHQGPVGTSENRVHRKQGTKNRVGHLGKEGEGLRNRSRSWDTDEYRVYWIETVGSFSGEKKLHIREDGNISN